MTRDDFYQIVNTCKELCKKKVPNHPSGVRDRNNKIIDELCRLYKISDPLAWEIFYHQNDIGALDNIYRKY